MIIALMMYTHVDAVMDKYYTVWTSISKNNSLQEDWVDGLPQQAAMKRQHDL